MSIVFASLYGLWFRFAHTIVCEKNLRGNSAQEALSAFAFHSGPSAEELAREKHCYPNENTTVQSMVQAENSFSITVTSTAKGECLMLVGSCLYCSSLL